MFIIIDMGSNENVTFLDMLQFFFTAIEFYFLICYIIHMYIHIYKKKN
jgi:hypothetical protein